MNRSIDKKVMNENNPQSLDGKFTRRDFLKSTSTAALGATLVGGLAGKAFARNDDTLKLALVGCGGRGSGAAGQALSTSGNVKLVAVADAFGDRLESSLGNIKKQFGDKVDVAPEHQFVGFDGYKQAIGLADVVILATPPGFRPIHFGKRFSANDIGFNLSFPVCFSC